jgi:uncharacterized membrane protein
MEGEPCDRAPNITNGTILILSLAWRLIMYFKAAVLPASLFLLFTGCAGGSEKSTDSGGSDTGGSGTYTLRSETTNFTRNQGGKGTQAIWIDRSPGFDEAVTLGLSGEPSGLIWEFDPSPSDLNASILWMDIDSSTATGSYTLTVTGDAAGDVQTVDVPLTVMNETDPDFGTDVAPWTKTIAPGTSGTLDVIFQWNGGFSDDATLACEDLPTGATCAFSTNPVPAGTDTDIILTVTVDASASDGHQPVRINAEAGGQQKATDFLLIIGEVPDFSLRSEVTNCTLAAGQQTSMVIHVDRTAGHSEEVEFTNSDAPTGVTLSFDANPTNADAAIVSIDVDSSTATGNYTLTIDGAAEDTRSVTIPLSVNPTTMPDFALAVDNTSLDVTAGASDTLNVAVQWTGGFSDDVALVCNAAPEIQCTFTPATVPSTTSTASLTVAVDPAATPGTYPVLVEGTGGTQAKMAAFLVEVN